MKLCHLWGALFFLTVFLAAAEIPLSKINEAAERAIKSQYLQYADKRVEAEVSLKEYQKKLLVREGEIIDLIVKVPLKKDLSRIMYLPVTIVEDGVTQETLSCRFAVKVYDQIYHAKTDLAKSVPITAELLYLKETDVLEYAQQLIGKDFVFADKILVSALRADKPIAAWKFKKRPQVKVGETVEVIFLKDNIKIKSAAKVLQQGYIGDKIHVRVLSTGKVFKAKITEDENYLVEL